MPARHPLQDIKTFPSLVKYLRDELDWPIETESFDDLTFDFAPEELGLKPQEAAKVRDIKQLRPLTTNQPWGIFFVSFEPKRLPVIALRKILGSLVIKKRASAKSAERAAWNLHDLLFVSAFGEGEDRQITLAHFSGGSTGHDIPTLKVLGWDELDTQLNLQHIDRQLHERLRWPKNAENLDAWRNQWSAAFVLRHRQVITTAQELAIRLALLAQSIRRTVNQVLEIETDRGPLRQLYAAFREALIHDLGEDDFADMYAQTITYGLFSAAVSRTTPDAGTVVLAENLADMVPITNPFLREMLSTFLTVGGRKGKLDFDELGIQEVIEVLNSPDTNLTAVVRNFGDRRQGEDPVIHFYEDFLKQYDRKRKVERGVFYTPQPAVSYIVRSVHELLQTEFGLEDGLASTITWGEMIQRCNGLEIPKGVKSTEPFVVVLDPATGTATFLVEAIEVIHQTVCEKWTRQKLTNAQQRDAWNEYVPKHLLPRLHGFELMMAPYAIAHMKIGLKLGGTGYRFQSNERARVYLTNTLEAPSDLAATSVANLFEALGHEAQAVNAVKRNQRFTIVIGNPPYSGVSSNMTDEAQRLVDAYKIVDGKPLNERKLWLQDDYVKFIRLAQMTIARSGIGVLGYITNHSYLDNPTFRGMRQNLMGTFQRIRLLDLHGSASKSERSPDGAEDKNVFDIRQGVAISLASRGPLECAVQHADLWGSRETKYFWLQQHGVGNTAFSLLHPSSPFYFFEPHDTNCRAEYDRGWKINDIMPINSTGFITARDHFAIDLVRNDLVERMSDFADSNNSDADVRARYFSGRGSSKYPNGDTRGWKVPEARRLVRRESDISSRVQSCLYRPFDSRFIYWADYMVDWPRPEVTRHMLAGANIALQVCRQSVCDTWRHVLAASGLVESCYVSNKTREIGYIVPLYLFRDAKRLNVAEAREPNFSHGFLVSLSSALNLVSEDRSGLPNGITPEDVFHYIYAVLHSPGYRTRYAEFLKVDFPRIPMTSHVEMFTKLAHLGGKLVSLHLMNSPADCGDVRYVGSRRTEIERVSWSKNTVWIDRDEGAGFSGVSEAVWSFEIGAYQVCEKWLKDRKGRTLAPDDIAHYRQIVGIVAETIHTMREVDETISSYGGWPGAFITELTASDDQPPFE